MGKLDCAIEVLAARANMNSIDEYQKQSLIEAIRILKENNIEEYTVNFYYEGEIVFSQDDATRILRNNFKEGYPALINGGVYIIHKIETPDENTTNYYLGH